MSGKTNVVNRIQIGCIERIRKQTTTRGFESERQW